jgi:hypothetical protein
MIDRLKKDASGTRRNTMKTCFTIASIIQMGCIYVPYQIPLKPGKFIRYFCVRIKAD